MCVSSDQTFINNWKRTVK